MPVTPDPRRSFLQGLSGFWSRFFSNIEQLNAYLEGAQLTAGQAYLDLLHTTLGGSIEHAPLFSEEHFKLLTVSEHQLRYREGRALNDGYFYVATSPPVREAEVLLSAPAAPLRTLHRGTDFSLENGEFRFPVNPFDIAGEVQPDFSYRIFSLLSPCYTETAHRGWLGAQPGDTLQLRVFQGVEAEAQLTGITEDTAYLASFPQEFRAPLKGKSWAIRVFRTPEKAVEPYETLENFTRYISEIPGTTLLGTSNVSIGTAPGWKSTWTSATPYLLNDLVEVAGTLYECVVAHTSGGVFNSVLWRAFNFGAVFPASPVGENAELFSMVPGGVLPDGTIPLDRPYNFISTDACQLYVAQYRREVSGRPNTLLDRTYVQKNSVVLTGRRAHAYQGESANGELVANLDYSVDHDTGTVVFHSIVSHAAAAFASYSWRLHVLTRTYTHQGAFVSAAPYVVGDVVTDALGEVHYVCVLAGSPVALTDGNFVQFTEPFSEEVAHESRELSYWVPDAKVDLQLLSNNFGGLLGVERPSSEAYRALLKGVARLFVVAPTFTNILSALHVLAELPVTLAPQETLIAYSSGVSASGSDGTVTGQAEGFDGVVDATLGTFSSVSAPFVPSDVGAALKVGDLEYVIRAVTSPTTVTLSPSPVSDVTGVRWRYEHLGSRNRFTTDLYSFTGADAGAKLKLTSTRHASNNLVYEIRSVISAREVELNSPYALSDENGVTWALYPTGTQEVETNLRTYAVPVSLTVLPEIQDPANWNTLTLPALSPLTTAFEVTDYVRDDTWWYRYAPPVLLPHALGPADQAAVGDVGLLVGADDEGNIPAPRVVAGTWYGDNQLILAVPPLLSDINQYLHVNGYPARIIGVDVGTNAVLLADFPPAEFTGYSSPLAVSVQLPSILHRRSVLFVTLDRAKKHHSFHVSITPGTPLPADFQSLSSASLLAAKPAHVGLFVSFPTEFTDILALTEELGLGVAHELRVAFRALDTLNTGTPGAEDTYLFQSGTVAAVTPGDGTFTFAVAAAPYVMPYTRQVVFGRVIGALNGSGAAAVEGINWTINHAAGTITFSDVPTGQAVTYAAVEVFLRQRPLALALATGETRYCTGGPDPTVYGYTPDSGVHATLLDRAVEVTVR